MIRVIKFWTEYRVGKEPRDWVLLAPKGEDFERTQTPHRVSKLDPEGFPENRRAGASYEDAVAKWTVIGPAYAAWKKGAEIPETGTPLEAWAGVTAEMAAALRALDVRTVEDVRDMGDGVMSRLRIPNARQLPKLARDYLEGQNSAEKDVKLAEMEARIEALTAALNDQAPEPKKRGRPRKQPAGEVAA